MLAMPATPPPTPPAIVQQASPVTVQCVMDASGRYKVSLAVLMAIMATEGGQVGQASVNKNGTRDNGPMQINTVWVKELKQYGITEQVLKNNGCMNVMAGAWILSKHFSKFPPWKAIGAYHSLTPHLNQAYQKRVYKRMQAIKDVQTVIDRANKHLFRSK